MRIALGNRIVVARAADGASAGRERFAVECAFVAGAAGTVTLADTAARYAYGTRFREDFVNGRVAEDRVDARAADPDPVAIEVEPLPTPVPTGFTGAVGRFELVAKPSSVTELRLGGMFELELTVGGEGNFGHFAPPDLSGQAGLHVLSVEEDRSDVRLTATYRLRADRPTAALPALHWPTFDPTTSRYVTLRTAALGIAVRTADGAVEPAPTDAPRWRRQWNGPDGDRRHLAPLSWGLATFVPWLAACGLWVWRRRRAAIVADPLGHRARSALAALRTALGRADADPMEAFAEFLAARLRCPRAAVVGGAVATRLRDQGVDSELAQRAHDLLEQLGHHRYTGGAATQGGNDAGRILEVADRLQRQGGDR